MAREVNKQPFMENRPLTQQEQWQEQQKKQQKLTDQQEIDYLDSTRKSLYNNPLDMQHRQEGNSISSTSSDKYQQARDYINSSLLDMDFHLNQQENKQREKRNNSTASNQLQPSMGKSYESCLQHPYTQNHMSARSGQHEEGINSMSYNQPIVVNDRPAPTTQAYDRSNQVQDPYNSYPNYHPVYQQDDPNQFAQHQPEQITLFDSVGPYGLWHLGQWYPPHQ